MIKYHIKNSHLNKKIYETNTICINCINQYLSNRKHRIKIHMEYSAFKSSKGNFIKESDNLFDQLAAAKWCTKFKPLNATGHIRLRIINNKLIQAEKANSTTCLSFRNFVNLFDLS